MVRRRVISVCSLHELEPTRTVLMKNRKTRKTVATSLRSGYTGNRIAAQVAKRLLLMPVVAHCRFLACPLTILKQCLSVRIPYIIVLNYLCCLPHFSRWGNSLIEASCLPYFVGSLANQSFRACPPLCPMALPLTPGGCGTSQDDPASSSKYYRVRQDGSRSHCATAQGDLGVKWPEHCQPNCSSLA